VIVERLINDVVVREMLGCTLDELPPRQLLTLLRE
jgi:hypothetical protein